MAETDRINIVHRIGQKLWRFVSPTIQEDQRGAPSHPSQVSMLAKSTGPSPRVLTETDDLVAWFQANKSCPDCGSADFLHGPKGGMAQNVQCSEASCGSEFNTVFVGNQVLFIQRIRYRPKS